MSTHFTAPDAQRPSDDARMPEPVRADTLRHRYDENRRPAPISARTVAIALIVSLVAALVMTATVLGLQLLAMSLGSS